MRTVRLGSRLALLSGAFLIAALSSSTGCIDDRVTGRPDRLGDYEQVTVEVIDVGIDQGPGMDITDGPVAQDPCACGQDRSCLLGWAEENFNCGVCITVACGERNANICTDLCGVEQYEMRDFTGDNAGVDPE